MLPEEYNRDDGSIGLFEFHYSHLSNVDNCYRWHEGCVYFYTDGHLTGDGEAPLASDDDVLFAE